MYQKYSNLCFIELLLLKSGFNHFVINFYVVKTHVKIPPLPLTSAVCSCKKLTFFWCDRSWKTASRYDAHFAGDDRISLRCFAACPKARKNLRRQPKSDVPNFHRNALKKKRHNKSFQIEEAALYLLIVDTIKNISIKPMHLLFKRPYITITRINAS